jgi:2-polyprenyl-3-methyl-5-hydroxy-6-metoxy-1,4-benzoquinol methylase
MIYKRLAIDSLDRKVVVLDIGCGAGIFPSILRVNGFNNLRGWEPRIELVNKRQDDAVEIGNCLADKEYDSKFDVIFIVDLLQDNSSFFCNPVNDGVA